MITIIAGSRDYTDYQFLCHCLKDVEYCGWSIIQVIVGGARGVDQMGERWAKERGITYEVYPAKWDTHGRGAGYVRNKVMAQNAEALIAFWDGKSKGTKHMIDIAIELGLYVKVFYIQ